MTNLMANIKKNRGMNGKLRCNWRDALEFLKTSIQNVFRNST